MYPVFSAAPTTFFGSSTVIFGLQSSEPTFSSFARFDCYIAESVLASFFDTSLQLLECRCLLLQQPPIHVWRVQA